VVIADVEHPLICVHPETGRKCLWISGRHALRIKGMTEDESRPLIDFFHAQAHQPEFTCRVRWAKGSLGIWDNRCVQHFAINDYRGFRRTMNRVEVGGDYTSGPALPGRASKVPSYS